VTRFSLVLTGIEQTRSFTRISRVEDSFSGKNPDFTPAGPVKQFLIFNDGKLKLPCDQDTINKLAAFWKASRTKDPDIKPLRMKKTELVTEGADVFGGDDLPPIPDEDNEPDEDNDLHNEQDWSGAEDEGEDGVGQV